MDKINFELRSDLSEFFNKEENRTIQWVFRMKFGKSNRAARVIFPDQKVTRFIFNKMSEHGTLNEDEKLEFFNWLYYSFGEMLNNFENEYKAAHYLRPGPGLNSNFLAVLYYYSIGYLLNMHCQYYFEHSYSKMTLINCVVLNNYIELVNKTEINIESEFDEFRPYSRLGMEQYPANLPLLQIAMIYFYNKKAITAGNAQYIAKRFGWRSKYSGKKLLDKYHYWEEDQNRRRSNSDNSPLRSIKKKIKEIEEIMKYLNMDCKVEAKKDIQELNSSLSKEQGRYLI